MEAMSSEDDQQTAECVCVFCYRTVNYSSNEETGTLENLTTGNYFSVQKRWLETCGKFYNLINLPANHYMEIKKSSDSLDDNSNLQGIASLWDSDRNGVCRDCFHVVEDCTKLFHMLTPIQRELQFKLHRLYRGMKEADENFQDYFKERLTGKKDEEHAVEFRAKVYKACGLKLQTNDSVLSDNEHLRSIGENSTTAISNHKIRDSQSDAKPSTSSAYKNIENDEFGVILLTEPIVLEETSENSQSKLRTGTNRRSTKTKSSTKNLPIVFKCFTCSKTFPLLRKLKSHVRKRHGDAYKVASRSNDKTDSKRAMTLECTAKITCKSKKKKRGAATCLSKSKAEEIQQAVEPCSESDPKLSKNWPALKKIIKSLRPHRQSNLGEDRSNYRLC